MTRSQTVVFYLSVLACSTLSGCGDSGPRTYPAGGVVKLANGQAVARATVSFVSPQGDVASAATNEDGEFKLGTFEEGDGALPGKHRVAVVPKMVRGGDSASSPQLKVPQRYFSADTSGLEFEVKTDGENNFEIVIQD